MILERLSVGPMEVNCYILAKDVGCPAIIIDPGAEYRRIKGLLDKHRLSPQAVINTHGHYDHIGCDDKFGSDIYVHQLDADYLKDAGLNLSRFFALSYEVKAPIRQVQDQDILDIAGIRLKVIHIPGHTPGGIALLLEQPQDKVVFTGDSLFCQGIGRTDLAGGDEKALVCAIKEKLFALCGSTTVYPGHGPETTIAEEKKNNPFLQ